MDGRTEVMSGENQPVTKHRSQAENSIEGNVHAVVGFEPGKLPQAQNFFPWARKGRGTVIHFTVKSIDFLLERDLEWDSSDKLSVFKPRPHLMVDVPDFPFAWSPELGVKLAAAEWSLSSFCPLQFSLLLGFVESVDLLLGWALF